MLVTIIIGIVGAIFYFLPTLIAIETKNASVGAILVVNCFLGWTLVGWVVALAWSLKK